MKRAIELLRSNAALIIGLALLCGMFRPPYFGSLVPKEIPSAHELRLLYDFSLIFFGGVVLCASTSASAARLSTRLQNASAWLGAASVIGIGIVNIARLFMPENILLPAVGVAITAAGLVLLILGWMQRLSFCERDDVLPVLMLAFLLNHVTGLLDLLPRQGEACAIALLPFLSAVCLARCAEDAPRTGRSASNPLPRLDQMRILALVIVCAEIFCTSFLRANYTNGGIGYAPATGTFTTYVVSALVAVAGYMLASGNRATVENALITSGATLGSLVICALLTAGPLHGPIHHLVTGLHSMLIMLLFGLIALWQHDGDRSCLTCAGSFAMLFGAAVDLTFSMAPSLLGLEAGAITYEQRLFTTLVATLLICLGCGVGLYCIIKIQRRELREAREALVAQAAIFAAELAAESVADLDANETTRAQQGHEKTTLPAGAPSRLFDARLSTENDAPPCLAPAQPRSHAVDEAELPERRDDDAIAWLAKRYALTPRETETAAFIAKGYSVKRIAEELNVTPSTIQSHSKSIYRKLGIHRKDELIALAERCHIGENPGL